MSKKSAEATVLELKDFRKKKDLTANDLLSLQSSVDFSTAANHTERLELLLELTLKCVPIAEALFKTKPNRMNGLLLTNLSSQVQSLIEQLEGKVDLEVLSSSLVEEFLKPHEERHILVLGKIIKEQLKHAKLSVKDKGYKIIKKYLDNVFIDFGKHIAASNNDLKTETNKFVSRL